MRANKRIKIVSLLKSQSKIHNMNRSVNDIVTQGLCIGCGLCESMAGRDRVEIVMTPEGRERPWLKERLDDELTDAVYTVCPGTEIHGLAEDLLTEKTTVDPIWGPLIRLDRGYAADRNVRFQAATGGVLTALAIYLLESGRVNFIAHIAADPERPMRSIPHISRTKEDVLQGSGSRYGPAAPLTQFLSLLDRGEPFAFVGKPCDIGAVRNLAKIDRRVDQLCLYLLTLVCGGASELTKSEAVLADHGLSEEELTLFRYRGYGNPGRTRIETKDGRAIELSYEEMWADEGSWQLQTRCKLCADAIGETADVAASDVWPGGGPSGEDAGFNGVLARTAKGADLVAAAVRDGALVLDRPLTPRDMDIFQPHQVRKKRRVWARITALKRAKRLAPNRSRLRAKRLALENEKNNEGINEREMEGTLQRIAAGRFDEPVARGAGRSERGSESFY